MFETHDSLMTFSMRRWYILISIKIEHIIVISDLYFMKLSHCAMSCHHFLNNKMFANILSIFPSFHALIDEKKFLYLFQCEEYDIVEIIVRGVNEMVTNFYLRKLFY
jgi:hypothetical protein